MFSHRYPLVVCFTDYVQDMRPGCSWELRGGLPHSSWPALHFWIWEGRQNGGGDSSQGANH